MGAITAGVRAVVVLGAGGEASAVRDPAAGPVRLDAPPPTLTGRALDRSPPPWPRSPRAARPTGRRAAAGRLTVLALLAVGAVGALAAERLVGAASPAATGANAGDPATAAAATAAAPVAGLAALQAAVDRTAFRVALLEERAAGSGTAAPGAAGRDVGDALRSLAAAVATMGLRQRARTDEPFVQELAAARPLVERAEGGAAALAALAPHAGGGVPSVEDLAVEFRRLRPLLQAQADAAGASWSGGAAGFLRWLLARVRLAESGAPDPRAATLDQAETELARGRLDAAVRAVGGLEPPARLIASGWLAAARVRLALDASVDALLRRALADLARGDL